MDVAFSVNNVPIRLTDERWGHIVGNKPYMSSYYEKVLEAVEAFIARKVNRSMIVWPRRS